MLSTHFVGPMRGDFASFASFEPAELAVIDENGDVVMLDDNGTMVASITLSRAGSAHALAPYAYSFNPSAVFEAGYRFRCSRPCLGIYETQKETGVGYQIDDETLMTGALKDKFSITSTSFDSGQSLGAGTVGNGGSCSGQNDFPNLSWNEKPWGTKSYALVVENLDNGNFVHLNLVDVDPTSLSIPAIAGNGAAVNFPSGIPGDNDFNSNGWAGPCGVSGDRYQFTIFALSGLIGVQVDQLDAAGFASAYDHLILDRTEIIGLED